MAGYSILLPASVLLISSGRIGISALQALLALLPVVPLTYAMWAVVDNARHEDELKQRIHFESVLITALLTGGLTFSYGLLETAGLVPHLPLVCIAPFMIAVWGAATFLIGRHYN